MEKECRWFGRFAAGFLFMILSALCVVGGIISLFAEKEKYDCVKGVQLIVSSLLAVVIIVAVLALESMFPSYERVMMYM